MKNISNRDPKKSFNVFLLTKLQDLLIDNLQLDRKDLPTVAACLQAFVHYQENIQAMVKASVAQENLSDLHALMKQMWVRKPARDSL